MYGKHFASLYEGSMIGAGAVVFAVWGYVIANQQPDRTVGSQVDLNPKLLAFIIGEPQDQIDSAIKYLCSPDPKSKSKDKDGKRLIKLGEYSYQVVNGAKYRAVRDEETRREQNRQAKRRERIRKTLPPDGEREYLKAMHRGASSAELDAIITKHLPQK